MANLVRVTGRVGLIDIAKIVSKKPETLGTEYTFYTASVIVAGSGVSELRFDPERNGRTFSEDDEIDVLAVADVFGNRPTLEYKTDYPQKLKEREADALLASAGAFSGEPADSLS
jgi:hypothetical protein